MWVWHWAVAEVYLHMYLPYCKEVYSAHSCENPLPWSDDPDTYANDWVSGIV